MLVIPVQAHRYTELAVSSLVSA